MSYDNLLRLLFWICVSLVCALAIGFWELLSYILGLLPS
jgi:hypothetical protein